MLKEVKRNAEVGEKIKVTIEHMAWKPVYQINEICIVEEKYPTDSEKPIDFSRGLVACVGKSALIFPDSYVVLEDN